MQEIVKWLKKDYICSLDLEMTFLISEKPNIMKTKTTFILFAAMLFCSLLIIQIGCKKDDDKNEPESNPPTLATATTTDITQTTAKSGGNVTDDGGSTVTARGVCWSTNQNPTTNDAQTTDGSGTGTFTSEIIGLTVNTGYYVRAYATNSEGTAYGNQETFITQSGGGTGEPCPGMPTVTDIDGNTYNTVLIGTQCWMAENLETTTYQNGTPIPNVTNNIAWQNLTTGAYVWYDNDILWKNLYGTLYNWYAVDDPNGLCPTGWHVPTHDEWTALTDFIGGTGSPHGNELKSCRQVNSPLGGGCNTTAHPRWHEDNTDFGTDDYGFSGLPGGTRFYDGSFDFLGYNVLWWSSTEYSSYHVWTRVLGWNGGYVGVGDGSKLYGLSVRCLRD